MKAPGVVRECEHPGRPHEHGWECYQYDKCRCPVGRAESARRRAELHKLQVLGWHRPAYVDPTGARRRLQALATLGYGAAAIGPLIGRSAETTARLTSGRSRTVLIRREHHDAICRVYDELWDKPRVGTTKGERIAVSRAKARAIRLGYARPLQWDDDTIDNPDAKPAADVGEVVDWLKIQRRLAGVPVVLTDPEKVAAAKALSQAGQTPYQIAGQLGMGHQRVKSVLREAA